MSSWHKTEINVLYVTQDRDCTAVIWCMKMVCNRLLLLNNWCEILYNIWLWGEGGGITCDLNMFFWKKYPIQNILCQCHVWHAPKWLMYILNNYATTSARPEVRGTADVGWRSLNPLPINPPRTHLRLYVVHVVHIQSMCLRTDGRWRTWMERDADAALRTILTQFVAMGVVYAWAPSSHLIRPSTRTTTC